MSIGQHSSSTLPASLRVMRLVTLMLVVLVPLGTAALAHGDDRGGSSRKFRSHAVGSTLNLSVPENPGDIFPATGRLDGRGKMGKFALDTFGRTEFLTGDQDLCGGAPPEILPNKILDVQAVLSFNDGSQILGLIDAAQDIGAGTTCASTTPPFAFRSFLTGVVLGGTGRFEGVTGAFEAKCSGFGIFELSSISCDLDLALDSKHGRGQRPH